MPLLDTTTAPEVKRIVARVNAKLHSDTVEQVMQVGRDLAKLFGYGTGKNRVPGLLKVKKAEYRKVGLRCEYSWARQVIHVATSPNLADPDKWPLLPTTFSALYQCSRMSPARFAAGMAPDPTGQTIIHPHSLRRDLQTYRQRSEPIREPRRAAHPTVIMIPLPDDEIDLDATIETLRRQAFEAGAGFAIGKQISSRTVMRMDTDPDRQVTIVTIEQYGKTERVSKDRKV